MKHYALLLLLAGAFVPSEAQRVLTLDSCRAMALDNNKQLGISRVKQDIAKNIRKSARTKYLPHVTAMGGYMFTSREISILNDGQKSMLSNIGGTAFSGVTSGLQNIGQSLTPDQKAQIDGVLSAFNTNTDQLMGDLNTQVNEAAGGLNAKGQQVVDAFRTDTRNIFAGSIMVTQPVFMGGAITALNRMADIGEQLEANTAESKRQQTLYDIDQAYWLVVSLKHKKKLAESFLTLVKKLDSDVGKMIKEGVATRSDGLNVSVKVNEAEMALTQADNGLQLARMLLCQRCGMPLDANFALADEDTENLASAEALPLDRKAIDVEQRPELKMLQNSLDLSKQSIRLIKAGNLPQVMLMGGYSVSNPNVYNGFQKKFGGAWNIGVLIRIPVWNWGDVAYKVRAAKGISAIAQLEMEEMREKMELQANQSNFKLSESQRKLALAQSNTGKAEENLRCANLGYKEGVVQLTTVMEAQTAWLQAQSQKIDAEIDVKLSQVDLKKSLGTLQ